MSNRICGGCLRSFCLLLLCFLSLRTSANAQSAASATLTVPQTGTFPRIEAYLDVIDGQGNFVHGLQARDVRILEDGHPLSVLEISELRPGVQVVIAINPGAAFGVRNSRGVSRYASLVETLEKWGKSRRGSTLDDWSILTTNGPEISHQSDPMGWLTRIMTDTLDTRTATPSLDTLFRAMEIAADATPRPGMGRSILFLTTPMEGDLELSTQNLADQAVQQGIHISVWLVVPPGAPTTKSSTLLSDLASKTGGQFLTYSGEETAPDPESTLEPLREVYRLVYNSQVTSSGAHQVVVEANTPEGTVSTPPQSFDIEIEPPDPAFVSPALEIQRVPPKGSGLAALEDTSPENFIPTEQNLQVLVDFPDGRKRPIVRTTLYVDGTAIANHSEPPFDQFTWDLKGYTTSGSHLLRLEAEDSLGLVGKSMDMQVQVDIVRPQKSFFATLYQHTPIFGVLALLLSGSVLLLVLILGGRIRPRPWGSRPTARRKGDPVTQPVKTKNERSPRRLPGWVNRLQWPQRRIAPKAYAFLSLITDTDQSPTTPPIPITAEEVTLGRDPNLAMLVLNDPSVEALHARLVRKGDGSFRLADEGSVAGTWINYTPISKEGAMLEHGDLIHVGRIGFRFTLPQPGPTRKPVVTLEEKRI